MERERRKREYALPRFPFHCYTNPEDCQIRWLNDQRWEVTLRAKDQGIASGQSAIFYDGEICLGGGTIE